MFTLISVAWYFGFTQLWYTLTHISTEWPWLLLCVTISPIMYDWFLHCVLAHRKYPVDPGRWLYKILVLMITVDIGMGSPRRFVLVHRGHHAWADQEGRDILYPPHHWYGAGCASPLAWIIQHPVKYPDEKRYFATETKKFSHILNDPWTQFCEKYTIPIVLTYWGILFVFAPVILFKFAFMNRAVMSVLKFINDSIGHMKLPGSYRNFNLKDKSYNNILWHYLFLGLSPTTLHNNHHGSPDGPRGYYPHRYRWYEIDLGYYGMRLLQPFLMPKKKLPK